MKKILLSGLVGLFLLPALGADYAKFDSVAASNVIVDFSFINRSESIKFSETTKDNFGLESESFPVTGQVSSAWMGYGVLRDAFGSYNSAIGYYSGFALEGSQNIALGYWSLSGSTGDLNVAVGREALRRASGSENNAVGTGALYFSPGSFNIAMGRDAKNTAPGSFNVAIGALASYFAPGSYSTALGSEAGYRSGGESNVFIGCHSGFTDGATVYYTNAITLGANSTPLGNNSMLLGNANTLMTEIKGHVGISNNLTVGGSLLPAISNAVDIGSASMPWRDLYVGSNSIYMAGVKALSATNVTVGRFARKSYEATATLSGANTTIQVNVPAQAKLIGVQLRVDTAVTSGDGGTSWDAEFSSGSSTAVATGKAFTKNTKVVFPMTGEIVGSEADILIDCNDAFTFSGGVIRAIVYYEEIAAMDDLP
jgi:acetyltransferase-like isoleucine patch superfamily enzyme